MAEFLIGCGDVGLLCGIGLKFIPSFEHFANQNKGRLKTKIRFSDDLCFDWAYLGAAKMPVRFSRNKTVNPVR